MSGKFMSRLLGSARAAESVDLALQPEEIVVPSLRGPSIETSRTVFRDRITMLTERRDEIASEIERLNGELANTNRVLHSQEVGLAALETPDADATVARIPADWSGGAL